MWQRCWLPYAAAALHTLSRHADPHTSTAMHPMQPSSGHVWRQAPPWMRCCQRRLRWYGRGRGACWACGTMTRRWWVLLVLRPRRTPALVALVLDRQGG